MPMLEPRDHFRGIGDLLAPFVLALPILIANSPALRFLVELVRPWVTMLLANPAGIATGRANIFAR